MDPVKAPKRDRKYKEPKMKDTKMEWKNTLERINSRIEDVIEQISNLEKSTGKHSSWTAERKTNGQDSTLRELSDNIRYILMFILYEFHKEEREGERGGKLK